MSEMEPKMEQSFAWPTPPEQGEGLRKALVRCIDESGAGATYLLAQTLGVETEGGWEALAERIADALLARVAPQGNGQRERAAWIDGAAWASMDDDEISVADIEAAADEKFGPEAVPSDDMRLDWLAAQTQPNHGVILCALDSPTERWASVQRVNQFHNPHKVEWCIEGETLREAIDKAMRETPTSAPDDSERARATPTSPEQGVASGFVSGAEYLRINLSRMTGPEWEAADRLAQRIAADLLDAAAKEIARLEGLLALARVAPRTTAYPHDCGCETCPEHTASRATPPAAETGEPDTLDGADLDTLDGVKRWMRSFFNGADQPSADDLIEQFEKVLRVEWSKSPDEVKAAYDAGFDFAKRHYSAESAAAPAPREVSEAMRNVLTQRLGLHEVIEVRYYVDHYAATLLTADGDKLVAIGKGDSVEDALAQLRAALSAGKEGESDA